MEPEKIARISELTRLSRERELTEAEAAERQALRQEYLAAFRESVEAQLKDITIEEPDGTRHPLQKKDDPR